MTVQYIAGHKCPIVYEAPYDTSTFVNEGPFFDTHPGVTPNVRRYERTDMTGKLVESWERDKNGVMVDVTKRDLLYKELEDAQENIDKLKGAD